LDLIGGYCEFLKDEIRFVCGGINHMDWFLKLEHKDVTSIQSCGKVRAAGVLQERKGPR